MARHVLGLSGGSTLASDSAAHMHVNVDGTIRAFWFRFSSSLPLPA